MHPILRYGGAILGFGAVLYAAAIALSFLVIPAQNAPLDTESVAFENAAYMTDSRFLVLNRAALMGQRDRVIVIGQSNVRESLRPALLEPLLPHREIDNLGLGGANVSEVRRVVEIVYDSIPPGWRGHTIFVLGVNYVIFGSNQATWRGADSDIVNEMLRFGLYARTGDGQLAPTFSPASARLAAFLLRPTLMASYLGKIVGKSVLPDALLVKLKTLLRGRTDEAAARRIRFQDMTARASDAELDAMEMDPDTRQFLLQQRLTDAGGADTQIPSEQFDALRVLAHDIAAHGDALVIVNLPLPRWHLDGLPVMNASFREQFTAALPMLTAEDGIHYLDLSQGEDADNFYDSVHPKPRIRKLWSGALARYLTTSQLAASPENAASGAAGLAAH